MGAGNWYPCTSRPVVSAGAGQNDHLSKIVSHILEPVFKMMPRGMEVSSTGDFIHRMEEVNEMEIEIENIDLDEVDAGLEELDREILEAVDDHLDTQASEAQRRYDNFDTEQLKSNE